MQIGLIGAGNMARALARGWNRPVLVADPVSERAQALAAEVEGEALATKPRSPSAPTSSCSATSRPSSQHVAGEVAPHAKAVASILAATSLAALHDAYPDRPVYRFIPSLPVEVRQGAVVQAAPERADLRSTRRSASCSPSSARSSRCPMRSSTSRWA